MEARRKSNPESIAPMTVFTMVLVFALTCVAVTIFGVRVYCYIPVYKGGGDFTTESAAILHFDPRFVNGVPKAIVDTNASTEQSKPVYVLQQSSGAMFVAVANATNNPTTWREMGRANKPTTIYMLNRDAVVAATYEYGDKP